MTPNEMWTAAWPWIWPTALLGLWLVACVFAVRRLFVTLERRLTGSSRLDPRMVRRGRALLLAAGVAIGLLLWGFAVPTDDAVTRFLADDVQPWVWPSALLAVWLVAVTAATRRGLEWLEQRTRDTTNQVDDALAAALRRPVQWLAILVGVVVWSDLAPLPAGASAYVALGSKGFAIVILILFMDGFVHAWMGRRALHSKVLATSGSVLRSGARLLIWVVGLLMVISTMGIDITPILASLGLGSLAIGLALKTTLEDFFAGLLLAADQSIRVGDFVEIDANRDNTAANQAGWVLSIGWRTTRLRTREDMHVIVPNSRMAQATVVNRSLPQSEVSFTVDVGVHFASDLEHVARVTHEVAVAVLHESPRGVAQFEPRVVFEGFADFRVMFRVWLRARSWDDHFQLRDAFIRAIHARYRDEGIVIPYPIRSFELAPGSAAGDPEVRLRPPVNGDGGA